VIASGRSDVAVPRSEPSRGTHAWLAALVLGAVLGALVLGVGGRLAMRGISLWEGRPRQFTVAGTLTIVGFGAAFGTAAAGLRAALDLVFDRWVTARVPQATRAALFAAACLALAVLVLTPLTVHRLVLFPPVVALYVLLFELARRRWTTATTRRGPAHGA
jgi:hypothetical protein